MAVVKTARLNLAKQTFRDPAWHTALDTGFDDADARLLRTGTADPNTGNETGDYVGQLYYETDATPHRVWICRVAAIPGTWDEMSQLIHGGQAATNITFDNNILLQGKEAGGTVRHLASVDTNDLIQYGDVNNAFELNVDALANAKIDDGVAAKRILTVADEGTGNGLDADTVDGIHAAGFIPIATLDNLLNDDTSATYFEELLIRVTGLFAETDDRFAHGLSSTPRWITGSIKIIGDTGSQAHEYDDDTEFPLSYMSPINNDNATGLTIWADPTFIGYSSFSFQPEVIRRNFTFRVELDNDDWRLNLRAWK